MRILLLGLSLPLLGAAPLSVVAVERRGLPPYEDDRRIYVLAGEGVAGLRAGERLQLQRPGELQDPGRLKVLRADGERAEALLDQRGDGYPLRGDRVLSLRPSALPPLPGLGPARELSVPAPGLPGPGASGEAPPAPAAAPAPHQEAIYFLEGDGSLSPKGREKLRSLVAAWGRGGAWSLALPGDRGDVVYVEKR